MSVLVHLQPATVALVPGDTATVAVRIRNTGTVVDEFDLGVVGDAQGWSAVDPAVISLFPGAEGDATITFTPPRLPSVPAGSMPFGLRVRSKEDPAGSIVEEGALDIAPFHEVSAELVPRTSRGSTGATHDVAVDNRGNVALEAALTALDADRLLAFDVRPPSVVAGPGAAVFAKVRVQPRRRFWRGTPVARPFQLQVTVADTPPVTIDGTLLQTPILPSWTVRALLIALALIVAAVVLWLTVLRPTIESTARNEAADVLAEAGISPLPFDGASPTASGGDASPDTSSSSPTASTSTEPTASPSMSPPAGGTTLSDGRLMPGGTPYTAPAGTTLFVTDLVFSNPDEGLAGEIRLERAGQPLLVLRLENFRDLDFHFSTPIAVEPGETLALVCANPCDGAALYYSGFERSGP